MAMACRGLHRLLTSTAVASSSSLLRASSSAASDFDSSQFIFASYGNSKVQDASVWSREAVTAASRLDAQIELHGDKTLAPKLWSSEAPTRHTFQSEALSHIDPISPRISSFALIHGCPVSSNMLCSRRCHVNDVGSIGALNLIKKGFGLQLLITADLHEKTTYWSRCFATQTYPSPISGTIEVSEKLGKGNEQAKKPKTLDDFQHEEIVGPTVERDLSPVADELRESLEILRKRILSFQKTLIVLGCIQSLGAVWSYASWHYQNPTWQLVPSVLLSFMLAFTLRQALQPIIFFGKLEERSRLRLVTLSLMIAKGFASYFNRARILVVASALGLACGLLYTPLVFILGALGFK